MTALSSSIIWQNMENYYNNIGPEAWTDEIVPLSVTSNTYLAKIYSQMIIAQINDFLAQNTNHDQCEPFYILEIGAGHGRFSFYLLQYLIKALDTYQLPQKTICYIMSDISRKNIASWREHPKLIKYIEDKVLEFSCFNALTDQEIVLDSGVIKSQQLNKPLFVICNYLFDSLPHDAFKIIDGTLYETELLIHKKTEVLEQTVNNYFDSVDFEFNQNLITADYYANKTLNSILDFYQKNFKNISFLIPTGGINFLDNIYKFTKHNLVLLLADKGTADLGLFDEVTKDPDIKKHGSVSMRVNFDAIARYVENNHGISMLMPNKSADFQIGCFILNSNKFCPHTTFIFNTILSSYSIDDLFNLCYKGDNINTNLASVEDLLVIFNLSEWDPNLFYDYHKLLLDCLRKEKITINQEMLLLCGINKVWNNFFKLEKNQDIPFVIGRVLFALSEFDDAAKFYNYSLEMFGEKEKTLYEIQLTYKCLKQYDKMDEITEKLIKINRNHKVLQAI